MSFQPTGWVTKRCHGFPRQTVRNYPFNTATVKWLTGVRILLERAQIKNAPITCDASNSNGELVFLSERTRYEIPYIHVEASVQPHANLRFSSDPDYHAWVVANRVQEGEGCPSLMIDAVVMDAAHYLLCDTYQVRVCIKHESGEQTLFHDTQIQVAKWGRIPPIPKANK